MCRQVSERSAAARRQLESGRAGWTPTVARLAAGWEQHCQEQEAALESRRQAAAEAQRVTEARLQRLAAAAAQSVQAGRHQLSEQGQRLTEEVQQRQQTATEEGDRATPKAV